jgi:hypothetical protein
MIPKRALYYWEGEPMSWLRQQSIATFAKLNPGWSIERIVPTGCPVDGDSRLARVLRSDWGRYKALSEGGGLYFDTDIVFCRPIPEGWLERELILTAGVHRPIEHVAVLGSGGAGNELFSMLDEACKAVYRPGEAHNYQDLGIKLVLRCASGISKSGGEGSSPLRRASTTWIEPERFLAVNWDDAERVWHSWMPISPLSVGVHWYGGDWTSMDMEPKVNAAWMKGSNSLIAQAWKMAGVTDGAVAILLDVCPQAGSGPESIEMAPGGRIVQTK